MNPVLSVCPVCESSLAVTRLHCGECDTRVEGRFAIGPFAQLSPEQLEFVERFVQCEGKLKHLAAEMSISYPTVRSRLHEVIRAMGYEPRGRESDSEAQVQGLRGQAKCGAF